MKTNRTDCTLRPPQCLCVTDGGIIPAPPVTWSVLHGYSDSGLMADYGLWAPGVPAVPVQFLPNLVIDSVSLSGAANNYFENERL